MTTRVLVTNFGPDKIEVTSSGSTPVEMYPNSYKEFYVHDTVDLHIKEVKPK